MAREWSSAPSKRLVGGWGLNQCGFALGDVAVAHATAVAPGAFAPCVLDHVDPWPLVAPGSYLVLDASGALARASRVLSAHASHDLYSFGETDEASADRDQGANGPAQEAEGVYCTAMADDVLLMHLKSYLQVLVDCDRQME